jgi:hypothetical protein
MTSTSTPPSVQLELPYTRAHWLETHVRWGAEHKAQAVEDQLNHELVGDINELLRA